MAPSRRLMKELEDIHKGGMQNFRNIQFEEADLLTWQGLIVPDNPPYEKGAFRTEISFPARYPFKPPKMTVKTKICHPNIDGKGQGLSVTDSAKNWKPPTKTDQVFQALIALVNDPQPMHPLQANPTEGYSKYHKEFCKNAEEFTQEIWGKATCGLKSAMSDPSKFEQRPQAVYSDTPQSRTLWKIDKCHHQASACGIY